MNTPPRLLVAMEMSRIGTLGPEAGKRSRGELVLEALQHDSVAGAVRALAAKDPNSYRPFNLVIGNREDCCWLKNDGGQHIELIRIPPGLHMLSSGELNDLDRPNGFGTCSSSYIALPAEAERPPLWLFADDPLDLVPFQRLDF